MTRLAERFEAKVDRSGEHHVWTGSKKADGSGKLKVGGSTVTAQRAAWELAHGSLPEGAKVRSCPEDPACVRLDHLTVDNISAPAKTTRSARGAGSKRRIRAGVWQLSVSAGRFDDKIGRRRICDVDEQTLGPHLRTHAPGLVEPLPAQPGAEPSRTVLPVGEEPAHDCPQPHARVPTAHEQLRLNRADGT